MTSEEKEHGTIWVGGGTLIAAIVAFQFWAYETGTAVSISDQYMQKLTKSQKILAGKVQLTEDQMKQLDQEGPSGSIIKFCCQRPPAVEDSGSTNSQIAVDSETLLESLQPVLIHSPSYWPVVVAGAAFLYLWWLAIILFDLSCIWHRYIRNSSAHKLMSGGKGKS